ncbi:hypothetical protein Tco_0436399 [Tanacetum coccineum]
MVQPYVPLRPVYDKENVVRKEEHDYDIPLQDGVMQPLTPQTAHITPPDDDHVAPIDSNLVNDLKGLLKTYDFETFIRKLLHQVSQSSHEIGKTKREMKSHQRYGSNLSFPYPVANLNPQGSLYKEMEFKVPLTHIHVVVRFCIGVTTEVAPDHLITLAKDMGFGQEMHQSEEPKALYGVTSPKDYAITYSNKETSHHNLYGVECLQDYAATFKYTRDDVSDSILQRNICDRVTP